MEVIQEILSEYTRMRQNGLGTKEALRALRNYVEPLSRDEKDRLATSLRNWETEVENNTRSEANGAVSHIRPLPKVNSEDIGTADTLAIPHKPVESIWLSCPNCGKKNRRAEVFCFACGHILEPKPGSVETKHFADASEDLFSDEYFGPEAVLQLTMRDAPFNYELRPQLRSHELVIGRSGGNHMPPDIDLADANAAQMGVSRLHLALKYEASDNTIQIYDLGSANGTFINGQRLHPRELRVLRNGDELRLGRLLLQVTYLHPGDEIES